MTFVINSFSPSLQGSSISCRWKGVYPVSKVIVVPHLAEFMKFQYMSNHHHNTVTVILIRKSIAALHIVNCEGWYTTS